MVFTLYHAVVNNRLQTVYAQTDTFLKQDLSKFKLRLEIG